MSTTTTLNMGLTVPGVSTEPGPDYAVEINGDLTLIDAHDHSSGKGVPITPSGMNITGDLNYNSNNLTTVRSTRFAAQVTPLAVSSDLGCIYVAGVDLYYNDENGNQIRLTQGGSIAGAAGSITNLTSPATATYSAGAATFVWQSGVNIAANTDTRSVIFRNSAASSKGMTMNPPAAMASDFAVTWPALPASQKIMTIDNTGAMAADYVVDNKTIAISSNQLIVKASGISGSQTANNINLIGKAVQENNLNLVVANTNAANSLAICRGTLDSSGAGVVGEGFTCVHSGTGVYDVSYNTAFNDTPAVIIGVANPGAAGIIFSLGTQINTGFTLNTYNSGAVPNDFGFNFIAIGQRA